MHLADANDYGSLLSATLVCHAWAPAAIDVLWQRPPLRALYWLSPHERRPIYAAAVRSLVIPASKPCPILAPGAFARLRELVVPFVHLRNSPAGRLADVLARASSSSARAISSVAIRADRSGHYSRADRAATAALHDDVLRALARHAGLAQLAVDYLDAGAVERMQAASATSAGGTPAFGTLRQLETRMLRRAVAPLVALLLNSGASWPGNNAEPLPPPVSAPPPQLHSSQKSMLRALQVTLLDHYYSPRAESHCVDTRAAVRAFGELRSLRVLRVHFFEGLCGLTPAELAALRPLAELRELCLTQGVDRDSNYDCTVHRRLAATPEDAITHDDLLAFVAPLPHLRRLEFVVPYYSFNTSLQSNARADFLAVLSASCPRLELLRLPMRCQLGSLASARTTPAFPELRCLDVYLSDDAAVIRRGKSLYVRFDSSRICNLTMLALMRFARRGHANELGEAKRANLLCCVCLWL
jgi:hypothetical protein